MVHVACRERMRKVHKILAVKPTEHSEVLEIDGSLMDVK
jgi:hypothetical protein